MPYNQFTTELLSDNLGISQEFNSFLPKTFANFPTSSLLLQTLEDAQNEALGTEKAKSEHIILPVIKELKKQNPNRFSYFSGYKFDVDKKRELKGFCDFIFSGLPNRLKIENPIFCVVEAKNDLIESGIGQCGAEMYAAQIFNEKKGDGKKVIYGCVTNAFSWAFLKLEDTTLYMDPHYVPLTFTHPHQVLAALQWVLDECLV